MKEEEEEMQETEEGRKVERNAEENSEKLVGKKQ